MITNCLSQPDKSDKCLDLFMKETVDTTVDKVKTRMYIQAKIHEAALAHP